MRRCRKNLQQTYPRPTEPCDCDRTLFHEGPGRELGCLGNWGFAWSSVPISWTGFRVQRFCTLTVGPG